VLAGLIDDTGANTVVVETNQSLHLYSEKYREDTYFDNMTFFTVEDPRSRRQAYVYDPTRFRPIDYTMNLNLGAPRGGYTFLLSKKAEPQTATFDIQYANGKKKKVEVDYSEVMFREVERNLVEFSEASSYGMTTVDSSSPPSLDGNGYMIAADISAPVTISSAAMIAGGGYFKIKPRFDPDGDPDPSKNIAYKIDRIWAVDNTTGYPVNDIDDLVLRPAWNDDDRTICVGLPDGGTVPSGVTFPITIDIYIKLAKAPNALEPFPPSGIWGMVCTLVITD
jgi:hypothetical protein